MSYYGVSSYNHVPQQTNRYHEFSGGGIVILLKLEIGNTNVPIHAPHVYSKAPIFHLVHK